MNKGEQLITKDDNYMSLIKLCLVYSVNLLPLKLH